MGRRKKIINNTGIPDYKIEAIARCILPDIMKFYNSEEGRKRILNGNSRRNIRIKLKQMRI